MIVEDHRDQRDREHQAGDDAEPQFEPHGKQRNLVTEALSLPITTIEIVRQYRHERAEDDLKHDPAPRSWRRRRWCGLRFRSGARPGLVQAERPPSFPPIL